MTNPPASWGLVHANDSAAWLAFCAHLELHAGAVLRARASKTYTANASLLDLSSLATLPASTWRCAA